MRNIDDEQPSTEQVMRVTNAPAAEANPLVAEQILAASADAYAQAERLKLEAAQALLAVETERARLAEANVQADAARSEAERLLSEAKAAKASEEADEEKIKQEEQMKLRIDHAKFANTHAESQIQAAERKATFLVGVITVVFAIIANDVMPKLKLTYLGKEGSGLIAPLTGTNLQNTFNGMLILAIGVSFLALIAAYVCLLLVYIARTNEPKLLKYWNSDHRPTPLIFFAAIQGLSKNSYYSRYESLTPEKVWEDVAFQAYKQARIATIKYEWFGRSWKAATGSAIIVVAVSVLVRVFYI